MKRLMLCLGCAFTLLACREAVSIPLHPAMPIRVVDETTNEWLHDHCDVKQVVALGADQIEPKALAVGSNFVEVLYRDADAIGVVMFGCQQQPPSGL